MKKILILFVAICLPLGIYLFLKKFGVNEFSVPVQFEHGIPGCDSLDAPHVVPSVSFAPLNGKISSTGDLKGFKVYSFLLAQNQDSITKMLYQLGRVQDAFIDNPNVFLFTLGTREMLAHLGGKALANYRNPSGKWMVGSLDKTALNAFLHCGLGIDEKFPTGDCQRNSTLALVDNNGWIRGFYDGHDTDDTERLIVELKILLRADALEKKP